ncbi:hypothetical protein B0H21DRAFT_510143 [Amylocystis lapponica]|nr:hypothetical protein B0H21DRAFT_510143 [Amylocystis lapponica]
MDYRSESFSLAAHASPRRDFYYSGPPSAPTPHSYQRAVHLTDTSGVNTAAAPRHWHGYDHGSGPAQAQFAGNPQTPPLSPHYRTPSIYQSAIYQQGAPYVSAHRAVHTPPASAYTSTSNQNLSPYIQPTYHALHTSPSLPRGDNVPQPSFVARTQCAWSDCGMALDDDTSGGIQRHLKEFHYAVWDAESQGRCVWRTGVPPYDGQCSKNMKLASLGKHIAECHLRSTVATCQHCKREYSRGDAMQRHLRKAHGVQNVV